MSDICSQSSSVTPVQAKTGIVFNNFVRVPVCVVDSHMHIVSSRCTPMPLLWNQLPGITPDVRRTIVEGVSKSLPFRTFISKRAGSISRLSCANIADNAVKANKAAYYLFEVPKTGEYRLKPEFNELEGGDFYTILVIMPMDMEYAHLDGYNGEKIYTCTQGEYFYKKRNYANGNVSKEKISGNEFALFTIWKQQIFETKKALVKFPWKLFSMYHYDPRRWKNKWDSPFSEIATKTNAGLFVGFKMYTPLGYKPLDPRLPNNKLFFARCKNEGIPVLTHCSVGGMLTHEWPFYLDMERDKQVKDKYLRLGRLFNDFAVNEDIKRSAAMRHATNDSIKTRKGLFDEHRGAITDLKELRCISGATDEEVEKYLHYRLDTEMNPRSASMDYFNDEFSHPRAWRKVLELPECKGLKLCLAHFGGDFWCKGFKKGRQCDWISNLYDLMVHNPNVYTDISYFDYNEGYYAEFCDFLRQIVREKKDNILSRILFGTDWYMSELDNLHYEEYCARTKAILDSVHKDLWCRFSMINPFRFYRFSDIVHTYCDALIDNGVDKKRAENGRDNMLRISAQIAWLEESLVRR